jgi:hypothetical protein
MIRSISCMVLAAKYDSPQCGHDHMGMPSMTRENLPRPKLRVTFRSAMPFLAHDVQTELDKVDGDDEEAAQREVLL